MGFFEEENRRVAPECCEIVIPGTQTARVPRRLPSPFPFPIPFPTRLRARSCPGAVRRTKPDLSRRSPKDEAG